MSVARTARRRRRQYKIGALDQIFGKRAAPRYKKRKSEDLDKREARYRAKQREMAARKRNKK